MDQFMTDQFVTDQFLMNQFLTGHLSVMKKPADSQAFRTQSSRPAGPRSNL